MTELDTNAFGTGYNSGAALVNGIRTQRAALQAGDAYASGDLSGASGILAKSGNIDGARVLDDDAAKRAQMQQTTQDAQRKEMVGAMLNMAQGLKRVPMDQRQHAFDTVIAPLLKQQGVDDAHIQAMGQAPKDDQAIDATISTLGGEAQKLQIVGQGDTAIDQSGKVIFSSPAKDQWIPVPAGGQLVNPALMGQGGPAPSTGQTVAPAPPSPAPGPAGGGTSYHDPIYDGIEQAVSAKTGVPANLLASVRVNGERSNAGQVSSEGARSVYQITPSTRAAVLKKYGVDAYASPQDAAMAAALVLKEGLDRSSGNTQTAVQQYVGGTDPKNYGPVTNAYVGRVMGGLSGPAPEAPAAPAQKRGVIDGPPAQTSRPATQQEMQASRVDPSLPWQMSPKGELGLPSGYTSINTQAQKQADKEEARQNAAHDAVQQASGTIRAIDDAINNAHFGETGMVGASMNGVAGTKARLLKSQLDQIKANLGFDQLSAMRKASPTGGALGQVSERELNFLQSTVANLDQGLSEDDLVKNLRQVREHYLNLIGTLQKADAEASSAPATTGGRPPLSSFAKK